jgi:GNAT superfamily N-acetyltransferase
MAANKTLSNIRIMPVSTRRDRRTFLLFPWRLYRHDPLWVPPVISERAAIINPKRNDLFQTGEVGLFIAWHGHEPVGTIGLAIDALSNQYRTDPIAVFGFFECINDRAVSTALLDHAIDWTRQRNINILRGPQSFGSSDDPGILIEGRETPRGLLMNWSMPYYQEMLENYGFVTWEDALAYRATIKDHIDAQGNLILPHDIQRINRYLRRRYDETICRVRYGDIKNWDAELETARSVFNHALVNLQGFVPMSKEEWKRMAESINPLLSPEFVLFMEMHGEPIAFALALPDINMALWHCNGLRFPWNYVQLWWYSRHLPGLSFKIMAMLPEYQGLGLDALIYEHIALAAFRHGYEWVDMSLTGANNPTTNKLTTRIGAKIDKRYRVYDYYIQ